jgi:preprotein translocase subunit YajC
MKLKILIIIVFIFSFAFSQDEKKKKEKVKFGGKAEVGIDFKAVGGLDGRVVNDSRLNRIGVIETELKVLPADSVELEFDLEFDHRFTDLNLKKLFVRYNFDNSNARVGFMKKMFSFEEIKNSKNELLIKKSMINDILKDFCLLEHDFTAQFRYKFPSYTLIGGFAGDGSNRKFVNLTLITEKIQKLKFVVAGMYENYLEKEDGSQESKNAVFGNFGLEFDGKITDFEFEGIWGKNPEKYGYLASATNTFLWFNYLKYKEIEYVGFLGLRFQESFEIKLKQKYLKKIIPLYEISYFNDSVNLKNAYWQARPGINFCFTKKDRLQWRTNIDLIATANNQTSSRPQIISERILTEIFVNW